MSEQQTILITLSLIVAYGVGCLNMGHYLVKSKTGDDLRELGSGNLGAKNVNRILGIKAAGVAFTADCIKGSLIALLALKFHFPPWAIVAMMLTVVIGHIYPVQLKFRGGKGVATAVGVILVITPVVLLVGLGMFALLWAVTRKFTLSGVLAMMTTPLLALFLHVDKHFTLGLLVLACLVLYAHRSNIAELMHAPIRKQ